MKSRHATLASGLKLSGGGYFAFLYIFGFLPRLKGTSRHFAADFARVSVWCDLYGHRRHSPDSVRNASIKKSERAQYRHAHSSGASSPVPHSFSTGRGTSCARRPMSNGWRRRLARARFEPASTRRAGTSLPRITTAPTWRRPSRASSGRSRWLSRPSTRSHPRHGPSRPGR